MIGGHARPWSRAIKWGEGGLGGGGGGGGGEGKGGNVFEDQNDAWCKN